VWRKLEPRADWQIALAITAALRVVYTCVAAVAAVFVHPDAGLIQSNALTENLPAPGGWHYALLGIWERFDTLWYLRIAERGYDLPAGVVFYPLYPWLIRDLSGLAGPMAAALLISTVAAFFYFWGLLRLARNEVENEVRSEFPNTQPLRTVMIAAAWPASFFFFAGYTEALAVALIVWCIVWARDERWVLAAACAFAAGLTRSAGTLVIVPLAIMAWRAPRRARWPVAIAPLGTLGYWFWLNQTGRVSVLAAYRTYWNTEVASPWTTLWFAIRSVAERFDSLVMISLVALIFFFVAGVTARRIRIEDRFFSAAVIVHLLLRLCWPPLLGAPRYLLPVYPAYLTMGEWAGKIERTRFVFLCGALFAFNLIWMLAFLNWSLVL
jgi:Mannosyltransferase (PIG-V)